MLLPLVSPDVRIYFIEYGDQSYLGKMTEMLLARCLLSYTFWKIIWLLVLARSLSYI